MNEAEGSTEAENRRLVSEYIQVIWNEGQVDRLGEFVSPDFISHDPADPEPIRGHQGMREAIARYHGAFPDLVNTIRDQIAEGDLVATRWTSTGTHQGPSFGLEATGNRRDVTGIQFNRVTGGLIVEEWHSWDTLGLLRQLGATEIPDLG